MEALDIIYQEEIDHVKKGDKWFKWEAKRLNSEPKSRFFEILERFDLIKTRNDINVEARLRAGFECEELKRIGVKEC